jgi:excisionase family DNA binding protein
MHRLNAFEERSPDVTHDQPPPVTSPNPRHPTDSPSALEALLTSKEASQILKIHPKVPERMAKRGDIPALKVGKFWRYRATTLDAWINSRLQMGVPTVPHATFILNGGNMQARYQYGNLTLRKRKRGPDVWQFRWIENGRLRSVLIGTIEKHPKRSDAERAVEHLRIKSIARISSPSFTQ